MPWTMKVVSASIRMDMGTPVLARVYPSLYTACERPLATTLPTSQRHPLNLLDGPPGGLIQRDRAVGIVHAVLLEDLEALLLPGAGDAEDRDLLGRVVPELQTGFDNPPRHDIHARVGDDRHHHRDPLHARLGEHQLGEAAGLRDRGVAADLTAVGGAAAVGADGVEQRQRAAPGPDNEPEVAAELGHVARHPPVVLRIDLLARDLERRRL